LISKLDSLIIILKKRPSGLFLFLFLLPFLKSQDLEHPVVSKIIIEGNKKTKDFILLREIHHQLNEPVDTVKILNDKNRIENLGIFSGVNWELLPLDDGTLILKYKVNESIQKTPPTIFPTYNESKGWSLNTLWIFNNFRGQNQLLTLSGSVGGEDTYGISFSDPWILNDHVSFSVNIMRNLYKNRFLNSDIELKRMKIGVGKWFRDKIKTEISLASEYKIFKTEQEIARYKYIHIFSNIRFDTRDIFWNPGKGLLISSSFEYLKGYDFKIFHTLIWNQSSSYYKKLHNVQKNAVIALNGVIRKKFGYKDRFFQDYIGSSNTIRGWELPDSTTYKLEPFRIGHEYLQMSIEYRYEIIPKYVTAVGIESGLSVVCYTDAGFIIKNGYLNHLESMLLGSGIGIRIPFPIVGVLRFDFGLGIINSKIKSKSFHFGIGQKF
tara:strand:- start:1745 stop:3055 length:1311 start_codon:yes stop_codon:yes gene_type:complete